MALYLPGHLSSVLVQIHNSMGIPDHDDDPFVVCIVLDNLLRLVCKT